MIERNRVRLLAGLAALPVVARAEPAGDVLAIMRRVLDGDLPGALAAARDRANRSGLTVDQQLVTELDDMARGDYATEGNRAFARFAPLWQQARSDWLSERTQPADALPDAVLHLADDVAQVLAVDLTASVAWLLPGPAANGRETQPFYISSGAKGPGKQRRGDARTPLGVYWVVDELDTARLPARYGSRVLPLDYPNALDRRQRRSGDGIWLHGIDPANNVRPPRDTGGCIAFTEDRIDGVADRVDHRVTPVVVGASLAWRSNTDAPDPMVGQLDAALEDWLARRRARDVNGLMDVYAPDFRDFGLSAREWRRWFEQALAAEPQATRSLDAVSHFVADTASATWLTRCRHTLQVGDAGPVTTWLRLYWQKQNGRLRIVAQSAG